MLLEKGDIKMLNIRWGKKSTTIITTPSICLDIIDEKVLLWHMGFNNFAGINLIDLDLITLNNSSKYILSNEFKSSLNSIQKRYDDRPPKLEEIYSIKFLREYNESLLLLSTNCSEQYILDNQLLYGKVITRNVIGKVKRFVPKSIMPCTKIIGICLDTISINHGKQIVEYYNVLYINSQNDKVQMIQIEPDNYLVQDIHFKTPELRATFMKLKDIFIKINIKFKYTDALVYNDKKLFSEKDILEAKLLELYRKEGLEENNNII